VISVRTLGLTMLAGKLTKAQEHAFYRQTGAALLATVRSAAASPLGPCGPPAASRKMDHAEPPAGEQM
jgi:hypothetical protein